MRELLSFFLTILLLNFFLLNAPFMQMGGVFLQYQKV